MDWVPYPRRPATTVVGDVRVARGAFGDRDLLAYLPPSHGSGRRFPVLYMHDGQNLFDVATSNGAEWQVDETLETLAHEGLEAIVVGIPHAGEQRGREYAGDGADEHLRRLVEDVKPLVDASFDTDPAREATGVAGSSLGGVISLHAVCAHPAVFGLAGVFSPAFWWNGGTMFELVERTPPVHARIHMDVGGREHDDDARRRAYVDDFHAMAELLRARGLPEDALRAVYDRDAVHHEREWAARLPDALRFLLARAR